MAASLNDIKKLREISGAGLSDCKKALEESNGDMDGAMEIIRKKGQAVAAKRSDRSASEGAVLVKAENGFGAIVALKCETDFVAKNADFVALAQAILDLAVANKIQSQDELLNAVLPGANTTVAEAITNRSGITGEKMELDGYNCLVGENISVYNHQNKNALCTMVQLNKANEEVGHELTLKVAETAPVALDESGVPQEVKDNELKVAIEKTKEEQVRKAVEAALKKAGINPSHVDSEDHIESNMGKGWITAEQAEQARQIKETVAAEKAANLPEAMIQNIAKGRMAKFFKENCLVSQEVENNGQKMTVAEYLQSIDKDLAIVGYKRFTLRAE